MLANCCGMYSIHFIRGELNATNNPNFSATPITVCIQPNSILRLLSISAPQAFGKTPCSSSRRLFCIWSYPCLSANDKYLAHSGNLCRGFVEFTGSMDNVKRNQGATFVRQITQVELIVIFGGFALLYVGVSFLRLRHRKGRSGLRSMALLYYGVIASGLYLLLTGLPLLGAICVVIGGFGVVYEYEIGSKL